MIDQIQTAIEKAKGYSDDVSTIRTAIEPIAMTIQNNISRLPIERDDELIKKKAEATAQLKISKEKELLLQTKDKALVALSDKKSKISSLVPAIPSPGDLITTLANGKFPKLSKVSGATVLSALSAAKQARDLAVERKKITSVNVEKAKEAFEYPITKLSPAERVSAIFINPF